MEYMYYMQHERRHNLPLCCHCIVLFPVDTNICCRWNTEIWRIYFASRAFLLKLTRHCLLSPVYDVMTYTAQLAMQPGDSGWLILQWLQPLVLCTPVGWLVYLEWQLMHDCTKICISYFCPQNRLHSLTCDCFVIAIVLIYKLCSSISCYIVMVCTVFVTADERDVCHSSRAGKIQPIQPWLAAYKLL